MVKPVFSTVLALTVFLSGCSHSVRGPQILPESSAQATKGNVSKQWRCDGGGESVWRCRDAARAESTKVSNTFSKAVPHAAPAEVAVVTQSSPVAATVTLPTAAPWISNYPDHYYAVQLIAVLQQKSLDTYIKQHADIQGRSLSVQQMGRDWYVYVLGVYATYAQASAAIESLPPELAPSPWIRPVSQLMQ